MFSDSSWPLNYVLRQVLLDTIVWRRGSRVALPRQALNQQHPPYSICILVDGCSNPVMMRMGGGVIIKNMSGCWGQHDAMVSVEVQAIELGLQHG